MSSSPSPPKQLKNLTVVLEPNGAPSAEAAYLADAVRLGVIFDQDSVRDAKYPPGLYRTSTGLISKRYTARPTPLPPHPSEPSAPIQAPSSSPVNSLPMSASLQGESHGLGTLQPPARYAIPARSSRAHLPPPAYPPQGVAQMGTRIVGMEAAIMRDDNERPIPYSYAVKAEMETLVALNSDPKKRAYKLETTEDGQVKKFSLIGDTGGGLDSWNFANIPFQDLANLRDPTPLTSSHEAAYQLLKKIDSPSERVSERSAILTYTADETLAGSRIKIAQTLINLRFKPIINAPYKTVAHAFPLGAVTACDAGELDGCVHDGLLALGRWKDPYSAFDLTSHASLAYLQPKGLVQTLIENGTIEDDIFWVRIAHPTYERQGRPSYLCFGAYSDPLHYDGGSCDPSAPYQEVYLDTVEDAKYRFGKWVVKLIAIEIDLGKGGNPEYIPITAKLAEIDSGSANTWLPSDAITLLSLYMHRPGFAPLLPHATVKFHFLQNIAGRMSECVAVGQASRFFVNPLGSTDVNVHATCFMTTKDTVAVLGLNFFRTFLIGFEDHDLYPKVWLRRQLDVDAQAPPPNRLRR